MNEGSRFELFSDFNCPFCYALHERLYDLAFLDRTEWRGVQHAPHLPSPMKPWQGSLGTELRQEVSVVQRLAPGLPIALPPGKPNTRLAIQRAIGLLSRDRARGMDHVRKIYRAFWAEGRDISDPQVLRDLTEESVEQESIAASHRNGKRPGMQQDKLVFH